MSHQMILSDDASVRNWSKISFFPAPMAFLIPISLVLSVTDTSIIFITQIHPTRSDIPAIHPSNIVRVPVMEERLESISD